jgi:hypothetical protein
MVMFKKVLVANRARSPSAHREPDTNWVREPSRSPPTIGLPTPYGQGLASRQEWEGSVNRHQPAPSPVGVGSARTAATTQWPLLNKQHSAHPRSSMDVAGPAENNQPQANWRYVTYGSPLTP